MSDQKSEDKKYLDEVSRRLYAESKENVKNWTRQDWEEVKQMGNQIYTDLAKAINENYDPGSFEVQNCIRRQYTLVKKFYNPDKKTYLSMARLYVENPDYRKYYDPFHPQLAPFLAQAMQIFADRELNE